LALSQRRIGWLLGIFAVLLVIAAARAFQLATLNAGKLSGAANAEHITTVYVPAARGSIIDRNGTVLAVSEAADDISATPKLVRDPAGVALKLAPLLHRSVAAIENDVAHPTSPDYTLLARQVPAVSAKAVLALGIPGIALTPDPRRVYPNDYLAAQVLGGVGTEGTGLGGLELEFNSQLAGTPGVQHPVFDAHGQPISVPGTTAVAGQTVRLTLDAALQQYTDRVVSATGEKYGALDATAIVLDPRTNAILAMSSWPRVNANDPAKVGLAENYAIGLNYEPGSTFKVVAIGGALSEGLVSPTTMFTIPSAYQVADRVVHDDAYHPTERLTTSQILAQSSNIGAVKIGQLLLNEQPNTNQMYNWMLRYGFGAPTAVDLPGEAPGIVPPPSQWSGSSIGNLPFGQGESVTPVQVAAAYAAIANGGLLRPPHIVESVGGMRTPLPNAHRILSEQVAGELRQMLKGVLLPGGTAQEIQIPGYSLAGKTGTANKVVNGTYSLKDFVASFVGFIPAQNPQIEALVVVDQPSTGYIYGTEVAAPAWKQIMDFALPYLKIPPG
jgi:cell division protein FtsI/penicillin-binding protein 2